MANVPKLSTNVPKLRTKEDWIRAFPNLFPGAVLYDKRGRVVRLYRGRTQKMYKAKSCT
jgi:hypothetical protein